MYSEAVYPLCEDETAMNAFRGAACLCFVAPRASIIGDFFHQRKREAGLCRDRDQILL